MATQQVLAPDLSVPVDPIAGRIHMIRGHKVMLDSGLAELYQVPTKRLNEAVRRNISRFPADFMFRLTSGELETLTLRTQIATSNRGGRRYLPYVFTEQGVAMLSSVLKSSHAIQVNIVIMRAFVKLREVMATHADLAYKIEALERNYSEHDREIQVIFQAIKDLLEPPPDPPKRRIGFNIESQPS